MSNLIATCMIEKSKRTCKVEHCSLARCCGCIHSEISRERYKLPYTCNAIERPCTITPPYGNFAGCIGCTYREPVREPMHVKEEVCK